MTHSVAVPIDALDSARPGLTQAFKAVVLAERVLQVHTDDARAALTDLPVWQRRQYEDAAAVALALLDPDRQTPAIYAAAHRLVDLGAQTPLQRRGLLQMVTEVVQRYTEALAGQHTRVVAHLEPLIALDRLAARPDTDAFDGGL